MVDNYIDESTITHLSKKANEVKVLLLTKTISRQLTLDVKKANEQYGIFELKSFTKSHDRFLIIDNMEVYHLGASLKDLGKKCLPAGQAGFAFSKLEKNSIANILNEVGL
ncbi:fic family toxin-antitoxin system [Belliella marina]|uniref:Fic family toxin-antitoxin system n=1 Tax=Belliella marina TaxID=1644146 RepID=A0ABW4VLA9_9BACT